VWHYQIVDQRIAIRPDRPFFGIIEEIDTALSFEMLDRGMRQLEDDLSDAMANWRSVGC